MNIDKDTEVYFFDMKKAAEIAGIKIKGKKIGRNELFKILRSRRILQEGNNLPLKKYIDKGYFKIENKDVDKLNMYKKNYSKALVSISGINFIKELLKEK